MTLARLSRLAVVQWVTLPVALSESASVALCVALSVGPPLHCPPSRKSLLTDTAASLTAPQPAPQFVDLGLSAAPAQAAAAAGWAQPTAIQAAAIPAILTRRDVLALAPTGSGKTAAFVLPLLQLLMAHPPVQVERPRQLLVLVLAPTRELAAQIFNAVEGLARAVAPGLKTVLAVGGLSINPQMMALRGGAQWVVATPGRLLDLVDHNALRLDTLEVLVLDEADRLLDLGFADALARLRKLLPARRQTLLFSATMPAVVQTLADQMLRDPLRLSAPADAAGEPDIAQRAIEVDSARRTALLRHLIALAGWDRVLVFVATQYAAEHVAHKLNRAGTKAAALHGQMSPGRRSQALADFQAGSLGVLVATDLAARGIDVPGLAAVVNHDLARSAVDHIHRIGRTGRAGLAGQAISFICADAPGSELHFRLIEKRQVQRLPREQVPGFEPAAVLPPLPVETSDGTGGIKGQRKSKKDKLREAAALAAQAPPKPPAKQSPRR